MTFASIPIGEEFKMSDLEMTKLCAEAMGIEVRSPMTSGGSSWTVSTDGDRSAYMYDPLHNDAQTMALVKKLGLDIQNYYWDDPLVSKHDAHGKLCGEARNADLNRAIVECVAKMQGAKP